MADEPCIITEDLVTWTKGFGLLPLSILFDRLEDARMRLPDDQFMSGTVYLSSAADRFSITIRRPETEAEVQQRKDDEAQFRANAGSRQEARDRANYLRLKAKFEPPSTSGPATADLTPGA